tara:strand:- start:2554 stop:3540 length:987 start_codon:yes stop_codon:yes gene_type:complete
MQNHACFATIKIVFNWQSFSREFLTRWIFLIMNKKDYYQVMGLKANASDKEIKTAYRRLARKYHPDISKEDNAEEKFKALGEAYEVLKDPEKRKLYDTYGADFEQARQQQAYSEAANSAKHHYRGFNFDDDIFESIFGQRGATQSPMKGQDYHSSIQINLEQAYSGVTRDLTLPPLEAGQKNRTIRVKIPAGVKQGQQIRLSGQGGPGIKGGAPGNLFLKVQILKHQLYDLKGDDIYLTLPITPWEAALGATVKVPTLAGVVDLKIPANAKSGQKLRLKGRGMSGQTDGNQYVTLKIVNPVVETDANRHLFEQMAEAMPFDPRKNMGI